MGKPEAAFQPSTEEKVVPIVDPGESNAGRGDGQSKAAPVCA